MAIHIPETVASVAETADRQVCCARCGCTFCYPITRHASASALDPTSAGEAAAITRARRKARRRLEREDDPVACPGCGWFQPNMTVTVRRHHLAWMRTMAFWAIPLAALAGALGLAVIQTWVEDLRTSRQLWRLGHAVMMSGPFLALICLALRFLLARRIDLNCPGTDVTRWTRNAPRAQIVTSGARSHEQQQKQAKCD